MAQAAKTISNPAFATECDNAGPTRVNVPRVKAREIWPTGADAGIVGTHKVRWVRATATRARATWPTGADAGITGMTIPAAR